MRSQGNLILAPGFAVALHLRHGLPHHPRVSAFGIELAEPLLDVALVLGIVLAQVPYAWVFMDVLAVDDVDRDGRVLGSPMLQHRRKSWAGVCDVGGTHVQRRRAHGSGRVHARTQARNRECRDNGSESRRTKHEQGGTA